MDTGLLSKLKQFDAYPKTLDDFRVKTFGGAIVTGLSAFIMTTLFMSELSYYLTTEVHPELFVDTTRHQKMNINLDVFFPKMGCSYLTIQAMDVSGEKQVDLDHGIYKERFDEFGKKIEENATKEELGDHSAEDMKSLNTTESGTKCKSCYGAESDTRPCCETCDDVQKAYREKGWRIRDPDTIDQCKHEKWKDKWEEQQNEGCRIHGYIEVSKVAGTFHIAPSQSLLSPNMHINLIQIGGGQMISFNLGGMEKPKEFNTSHQINELSFGESLPGVSNPLDGTNITADFSTMMFQYFVKVVPTVYRKLSGESVWSNQYSFTKHKRTINRMRGEDGKPGMFVQYDLSPMLVQYTEKRRSFTHFLTSVCAIIGGVFTVAGMIDSTIYHSAKVIKKKIDLGKTG